MAKTLKPSACVAKPDTILYPDRPPVSAKVDALVIRTARENSGQGYERIGAPSPTWVIRCPIKR